MKKREKNAVYVILAAAVLLLMILLTQYWFAHRGILEGAKNHAQDELQIKRMAIEKKLTLVEAAVDNMVWAVEENLSQPDKMLKLALETVKQNKDIVGCGILFLPNYYASKGHWFEPYAVRRSDGHYETMQLGSADHDYTQLQLFKETMAGDSCLWTEPYLDKDGARMMLTSYAHPIHDKEGQLVGVLAADVSLDWLKDVINTQHSFTSSINLMLSKVGQLMVCPTESLTLRRTIQEESKNVEDSMIHEINRNMLAGEEGNRTIINWSGDKKYVFYAPIGCNTGWSMAVVCSDKEIYHELRQVGLCMLLLMLLGLILLAFIIQRLIHNLRRLQEINSEKERIGNELRIASAIQSGMLPKTAPFSGRDDIDVFSSLVPAKEVGGDLYDFYIRDEKLFFCIGDVSGKGVPASLVMAVTRSLFRTVSARESHPSTIVSQMNSVMSEINDSNMFVTFFVGVLDLPSGRLRYCNAGHCPPLLVGSDVEMLPVEPNIPVGLVSDWNYSGQETFVKPQTTLFLYTDGLTEAEDIGHHQFGEERMKDTVFQAITAQSIDPEALFCQMTNSVNTFVDKAQQSDDLTMLIIQYKKEQRDLRLQCHLTLTNDTKEVPKLHEFVAGVTDDLAMDDAVSMQLDLALEEAVVNVMSYAYQSGKKGNIDIEARADDLKLVFVIRDSGIPFDPTAKEDADTTLSADERPIGGLGIFLVRQLMDSINYERVDGQNVLTLIKKLNSQPAE